MSKTRDTGYLANVIQVHDTGVRIMSGSTMLMAISSSGAVTITGEMSGSDAANALLLDGTGSLAFTTTASYNAFSASYAIASGSFSSRTTQVERTYASTGSNTFTGAQYVSDSSDGIGFTSTASFYTDGGLRVGKNAYVSGTAYFNNIVVFGTSSIQYITSSQVNIGANIITVNTDTPAVRFGGLSVFDSGSTQLTGSMLWDSEKNHWVYSNPSGSGYSGGMFISGPRSSALGSEQGTTACMLLVGQGSDHLTSSMIYHSSICTNFYSNALFVSSSGNVGVNTITPLSRFDVALQGCESLTIGNSSTTITCGDLIGALTFVSRDASTNSTGGIAGIRSYATQTYNTGGVEGDLRFYVSIINTQPNGTILSGLQVLRLSQDGVACFACRVCVPSLSVSNTNAVLTIQGTATSGEAQLDISGKNSGGTTRSATFKYDSSDIIRIGTSSPIGMRFETNDVTRLTIASTGVACFACQVCSPQFTGGFVCAVGGLNVRGASTTWSSFNSFPDNPGGSGDQCKTVLAGSFVGCTGHGPQLRFSGPSAGFIDIGQDCNGGFVVEATDTPRLNITQCGNVGFNEPNPGTDKMVILGGTANNNVWLRLKTDGSHGIKPQIHFDSGLVGTNRPTKAMIMGGYNSPTGGGGGVMQFYTNDTSENLQQRMCIDPAGQVTIMGALAKGSGSFRICHPLSSKVKTHSLVHSFIEGPNADLIYSGHTKLVGGVSCINIDCISRMTEGTFEALNRCVRIFTTNETSWSAVKGKVCGNIVIIESQNNTSEDEISWMVIGERQDQHMFETEWTDAQGRVITEPEIIVANDNDIVA